MIPCKFKVGDRAIVTRGDNGAYWYTGKEFTVRQVFVGTSNLTFLKHVGGSYENVYAKSCAKLVRDTKIARKVFPDFQEYKKGWILV